MNYMRADRLIQLIKENYKDMNEEDYQEIKNTIENIAKKKIDDVFGRVLGEN